MIRSSEDTVLYLKISYGLNAIKMRTKCRKTDGIFTIKYTANIYDRFKLYFTRKYRVMGFILL